MEPRSGVGGESGEGLESSADLKLWYDFEERLGLKGPSILADGGGVSENIRRDKVQIHPRMAHADLPLRLFDGLRVGDRGEAQLHVGTEKPICLGVEAGGVYRVGNEGYQRYRSHSEQASDLENELS